jgi:CHAD domain-containing protein
MGAVVSEVESKFEPADGARMPEFISLTGIASVAGPSTQELEATYFDTSEWALLAAGLTLRRRTGGDDAGWHLKVPSVDGGRDELREPLGDATDVVPEPLREAVQLYARGRNLGAVAHLGTRRTTYQLCNSEGRPLAQVCDDHVTARTLAPADTGLITAWREWEVELVDGDQSLLTAAGDLLQASGARPASSRSKLARVLGDRFPESPAGGEEPLRRRSPAAAVVGTRLREQVAELSYRDPLVRRDVPDSVHKMRVAMRRLRSALATFRPLLNRQQTEPLRDELKWIAGVLGEARDAEVMHQRLAALIADEPVELVLGTVSRRVDGRLGDTYRVAHERSIEAMQSQRYYSLVDSLNALVTDPPWTHLAEKPAAKVLPARVAKDYKRLRQRVLAAQDAPDQPTRDERLHEVRKAAKRARYAAEALTPVYGRDARRFAKATKRLQTVLGDHHDAVVTQPVLRQLAVQAHLDGDNAFTYGRLHAGQQAHATTLQAEYHTAWSRASRKKLRGWLA